jgi:uracil-DNA glycosylase
MLPEPPQVRLAELQQRIRTHDGCGLPLCEGVVNFVPGEGPADARVMVVGEAPGRFEDESGRPFVGRAGALLGELLAAAGLAREDVYITNVVKARPPRNRDPSRAEVEHWMPVLESELECVSPEVVVPLGRHALAHFAPGVRIGEAHGRVVAVGGRTLYPLYHPAAALRSTRLRETAFDDARRLASVLASPPERLVRRRSG